ALLTAVEKEKIPICILFANLFDQLRASPATWLINVPGHLHHHDFTKLSGLNKLVRANVVIAAPALTTDLYNLLRLFYGFEDRARIFHRIGHRLLDIRIAPGSHCFSSMQRMLEVCSRHNHRVDVLAIVELFVITGFSDLVARQFAECRRSLLATAAPNVGHGGEVKVELLRMQHECRYQSLPATIGITYNPHLHSIIRAQNSLVTRRFGG